MADRKQEQQRRKTEKEQAEQRPQTSEERQNIRPQAKAQADLGNARKSHATEKDKK